jgi:hypothetical protein
LTASELEAAAGANMMLTDTGNETAAGAAAEAAKVDPNLEENQGGVMGSCNQSTQMEVLEAFSGKCTSVTLLFIMFIYDYFSILMMFIYDINFII